MKKYEIRSEDSCSQTIEAESMQEACEELRDWLREGSWGDSPVIVHGMVYELDEDGERTDECESVKVEVNTEAKVPECAEGCEHDWRRPHEVVGGLDSNPGVWSLGGAQIALKSVCSHCGKYQHYQSESTPGQYPETPGSTTYSEADEASEAWVGQKD